MDRFLYFKDAEGLLPCNDGACFIKKYFEHQYEKNLLYQNICTTFACLFLNTVEMDVSHIEIQMNTQTHISILQNFICEIRYLS